MLTTALEPNEILREIRIALPQKNTGQAYAKVAQPASGFAVVGVAVNLTRGDDGRCGSASVGITGVAAKAYRAGAVENALKGSTLDEQAIATASAHAADSVDANADLYASAEYRRHLAQVHTRRAIQQAIAKL